MRPSTLISMGLSGRARLLLSLRRLSRPFYRLFFLASASENGILRLLADGPVSLDRIAIALGVDAQGREALDGWLEVGCVLGELGKTSQGYGLRGYLARRLAMAENDDVAAYFEVMGFTHSRVLRDGIERLRKGEQFTFDELDPVTVARGSRIAAPFVQEVLDQIIPTRGPFHLLEVGCGSAVYLRHATSRNPDLTALGIDVDQAVVDLARERVCAWGLADRARIELGDILDVPPRPEYDLVTLHNGIYYFPVSDRVSLLEHLKGFVRPGGRILLTTNCRGRGAAIVEVLSYVMSATRGGRLPTPAEMLDQMEKAGLTTRPPIRPVPREPFHAFVGTVEPSGE